MKKMLISTLLLSLLALNLSQPATILIFPAPLFPNIPTPQNPTQTTSPTTLPSKQQTVISVSNAPGTAPTGAPINDIATEIISQQKHKHVATGIISRQKHERIALIATKQTAIEKETVQMPHLPLQEQIKLPKTPLATKQEVLSSNLQYSLNSALEYLNGYATEEDGEVKKLINQGRKLLQKYAEKWGKTQKKEEKNSQVELRVEKLEKNIKEIGKKKEEKIKEIKNKEYNGIKRKKLVVQILLLNEQQSKIANKLQKIKNEQQNFLNQKNELQNNNKILQLKQQNEFQIIKNKITERIKILHQNNTISPPIIQQKLNHLQIDLTMPHTQSTPQHPISYHPNQMTQILLAQLSTIRYELSLHSSLSLEYCLQIQSIISNLQTHFQQQYQPILNKLHTYHQTHCQTEHPSHANIIS